LTAVLDAPEPLSLLVAGHPTAARQRAAILEDDDQAADPPPGALTGTDTAELSLATTVDRRAGEELLRRVRSSVPG
jgi:hypothetical protein